MTSPTIAGSLSERVATEAATRRQCTPMARTPMRARTRDASCCRPHRRRRPLQTRRRPRSLSIASRYTQNQPTQPRLLSPSPCQPCPSPPRPRFLADGIARARRGSAAVTVSWGSRRSTQQPRLPQHGLLDARAQHPPPLQQQLQVTRQECGPTG